MTKPPELLDNQEARFVDTDSLVCRLSMIAKDSSQWNELGGVLRAISRALLDATLTLRHEPLEEYEAALAYAARRIQSELPDDPNEKDPRYFLGRVESLLDICDVGIDRSVSEEVLGKVQRPDSHAFEILQYLMTNGECSPKVLATSLELKPNHISNILRWMESFDLIRRTTLGRGVSVSLGPKGNETYRIVSENKTNAKTIATPSQTEEYVGSKSHRHSIYGETRHESPLAVDDTSSLESRIAA